MLDRKFILENIEQVETNCHDRGVVVDVRKLVDLEQQRRSLQTEAEEANRQANAASKAIGKLLVKNNIYFAGVDFVQEKLIGDINVTSPTGLAAYKDLSGINLAKLFWNNI